MIIFPAIDIRGGKCVRLKQGKFEQEEVFGEDPIAIAKEWEKRGAKYLHVVDLDGAKNGAMENREVIGKIVNALSIPVQVGGGIRQMKDIQGMIDMGVARVILGTAAVQEEALLKDAIEAYADKIAVSIDAHGGFVAIEGWTKTSEQRAIDLAKKLESMGLKTLIYTDIAKDGMLSGPNMEELKNMQTGTTMNLIASGGISSKSDVEDLRRMKVYGAIIGKALYTGNIQLEEV